VISRNRTVFRLVIAVIFSVFNKDQFMGDFITAIKKKKEIGVASDRFCKAEQ
jgi:hypothetical protein